MKRVMVLAGFVSMLFVAAAAGGFTTSDGPCCPAGEHGQRVEATEARGCCGSAATCMREGPDAKAGCCEKHEGSNGCCEANDGKGGCCSKGECTGCGQNGDGKAGCCAKQDGDKAGCCSGEHGKAGCPGCAKKPHM